MCRQASLYSENPLDFAHKRQVLQMKMQVLPTKRQAVAKKCVQRGVIPLSAPSLVMGPTDMLVNVHLSLGLVTK